jgi:hypothetical protein
VRPAIDPPATNDLTTTRGEIGKGLAEFNRKTREYYDQLAKGVMVTSAPHALIATTVGSGKTQAKIEDIDFTQVDKIRVDWFVPDHALGEDTLKRIRAKVPQHLQHLVRIHYGRKQKKVGDDKRDMCEDPINGPLADQAEELGLSPHKHVCPPCPLFRAGCKHAAQYEDTGPGIVIKPMSYMIHGGYRNMKVGSEAAPYYYVVDESPFPVFLDLERAKKLPLSDLKVDASVVAEFVRATRKDFVSKLKRETGFVEFRRKLFAALRDCDGPLVPVECMKEFIDELHRTPDPEYFELHNKLARLRLRPTRCIRNQTAVDSG